MSTVPPLPGLDRLIATCRQHNLPLELSPPLSTAPQAGELIFGQPLDPLLAALYQRLGAATWETFALFRPDRERDGLFWENEYFKRDGEEPFRSTLLISKEIGFSYYLGLVPELADAQGLQPVVYVPFYPAEVFGIPIASNLDQFFDLYSRYLELMVVDNEYVETGFAEITFPWDMAHLVAQDAPLVTLIRAGRFTPLMNDYDGARKWVTTVLAALT